MQVGAASATSSMLLVDNDDNVNIVPRLSAAEDWLNKYIDIEFRINNS